MKQSILILSLTFGYSQSLDVTFRYIERSTDNFIRVYVPGEMNNWGPNSNGVISPNAASQMILNEAADSYDKSYSLTVGSNYLYKIHFHHNSSGTDYTWISDPLNSLTTDDGWNNSILEVTDPLFFQPARHLNEDGLVDGFSVGIFTNGTVNSVEYAIGEDTVYATDLFNEGTGIFYASLDPPRTLFESYWVHALIDGEFYTVYDQPEIEIEEEALPTGVKMGPNWINGEMILAVFAPEQPVMQVIVTEPGETGSSTDAFVMKKAIGMEDTWWIELELSAGQYTYEYLLLNGNRIADPLSRRIDNGKTRIEIGGGGVTTADDFNWQSDEYIRPSLDTLVIYEIHIDDFAAQGSGQGTFSDVISRLDHLKASGINAIELMPVTEFPGNRSWGYDPELMSAVESSYGTPEDFKELVDEAHQRGIAVILDLVWNHIRSSSPIWQIQPDYNLNPYIKIHTELNPNETEGSWGMLDMDHFNPLTVDYVNQVHEIWVGEYRIDGFRFDATRYMGWDLSQPELGFPAWTYALDEFAPGTYQIAEHLPAHPWLIDNTYLTSSWHDSFHDLIKEDAHGQFNTTMTYMSQIIGLHEYSNWGDPYSFRTQAVKYMISHDEQSVIQEMVAFDSYSVEEARARDKFLATLMFTSMGIPMLFQGQEFGFQSGWNDDNGNGNWDEEKLGYRAVDWSLLNTDVGQSHLSHYSKMAKFRKINPAFSKGTFHDLYRFVNEKVIVYGYKDESDGNNNDQVVVIANFSASDKTVYNVPFLSGGNWYNITEQGNDLYTGDGNYGEYSIPAKSAVVYANQEWELGTKDETPIPTEYQTLSAYPNPFNGQIQINFSFADPTSASVFIFDVIGRLVKTFPEKHYTKGDHFVSWIATDDSAHPLSSGVYIISLRSETGYLNKKILYLK
jgi:1,4-alpha-glucan branching enzyme